MASLEVLIPAMTAVGGVLGWLTKHYLGKNGSNGEFRGETRAVMKQLVTTQDKIVDLMGEVHREITNTNKLLEIIEQRGRGGELAIRKILERKD